jgi:hypothetical protein
MSETNAGNFLSPEALVFLPLALLLDLVGIILIIFALDDFFITDIIGFATIGTWSWFRSQIKNQGETSSIEMPDREERKNQAQQIKQAPKEAETTKVSKTAKTSRMAKWGKWLKFLEFVPYLGVLPFWTASVFFELKE